MYSLYINIASHNSQLAAFEGPRGAEIMAERGVLMLVMFAMACAIAALTVTDAAVSYLRKQHEDGFYDDHLDLYDRMAGFSPLLHPDDDDSDDFVSEGRNMVEEEGHGFSSSVDRDAEKDLHALLSLRKAITSDPQRALSNWTAENSENVCSWNGISCRINSERVFAVILNGLELEGSLSPSIANLSSLSILDLSENNLTGFIPKSLANLRNLWRLNLSRNQLEGQIPASFSNISTLAQLDLGKNNLSGRIPQSLSKLLLLIVFDVSSNSLCGQIPMGTQFDTFDEKSFQNNTCLCGRPLPQCKVEGPIGGISNSNNNVKVGWLRHVDEKVSLTALGIGAIIGFEGVITIFITWKKARHWVMPPNKPKRFYGMYRFPQ